MTSVKLLLASFLLMLGAHHHTHHHVYTGRLSKPEAVVFTDLVRGGLTRNQASGVLANAEHESNLNVENHAMDTNGFRGYGLLSWNSEWYPGAASLVTGNPQADLARQVGFIVHATIHSQSGLQGQTAYQVGGNWAQFVEGCQGCQPGGHQWTGRAGLAMHLDHLAR